MAFADFFSPDYARAKNRFLAAATRAGCRLESFNIGARGPSGEALSIDVAVLGRPQPARLLLLSSGIHGVEGFFGSAVQLAWLEQQAAHAALPADTAIVFVHALNPYGFAWRRRWNEHNVDLNRNFIDDRSFLAGDPDYALSQRIYGSLNAFLNPGTPPSRFEPYALKAAGIVLSHGLRARANMPAAGRPGLFVLAQLVGLGVAELERALTAGQYEHPDGLFYGGDDTQVSTSIMREQAAVWAGAVETVIHVDLHTGLGTSGHYQLLIEDEEGSARAAWLEQRFGAANVTARRAGETFRSHGLMASWLERRFVDRRYHCLIAEFGTCPPIRVLGALRAERRAHLYSAPGSATHEWAKRELMEVFCPASTSWREAVVTQGLDIMARALRALADKS